MPHMDDPLVPLMLVSPITFVNSIQMQTLSEFLKHQLVILIVLNYTLRESSRVFQSSFQLCYHQLQPTYGG
jgi:hypothetical protein